MYEKNLRFIRTCLRDFNVYVFFTFLLCAAAQKEGGARHNTPTLNTPLDVHILMITAY